MNVKILIGFFAVLAVIIALPIVATMAGGKGGTAHPAPAPAPPATGAAKSLAALAPATKPAAATPRKQKAARPAPPPSNQKQLENTVWEVRHPQYGPIQIQLNAGSQAVATASYQGMPVEVQGRWNATANKLTVNGTIPFVNQPFNVSCDIQGNQIFYERHPIKRLR